MPAPALSIRDAYRIREGLPVSTYDEIKRVLDVSDQQVATSSTSLLARWAGAARKGASASMCRIT